MSVSSLYISRTVEGRAALGGDTNSDRENYPKARTFSTVLLGPFTLHFLVLKRVQNSIIPNSYLVRSHKHTVLGSTRKISPPLN